MIKLLVSVFFIYSFSLYGNDDYSFKRARTEPSKDVSTHNLNLYEQFIFYKELYGEEEALLLVTSAMTPHQSIDAKAYLLKKEGQGLEDFIDEVIIDVRRLHSYGTQFVAPRLYILNGLTGTGKTSTIKKIHRYFFSKTPFLSETMDSSYSAVPFSKVSRYADTTSQNGLQFMAFFDEANKTTASFYSVREERNFLATVLGNGGVEICLKEKKSELVKRLNEFFLYIEKLKNINGDEDEKDGEAKKKKLFSEMKKALRKIPDLFINTGPYEEKVNTFVEGLEQNLLDPSQFEVKLRDIIAGVKKWPDKFFLKIEKGLIFLAMNDTRLDDYYNREARSERLITPEDIHREFQRVLDQGPSQSFSEVFGSNINATTMAKLSPNRWGLRRPFTEDDWRNLFVSFFEKYRAIFFANIQRGLEGKAVKGVSVNLIYDSTLLEWAIKNLRTPIRGARGANENIQELLVDIQCRLEDMVTQQALHIKEIQDSFVLTLEESSEGAPKLVVYNQKRERVLDKDLGESFIQRISHRPSEENLHLIRDIYKKMYSELIVFYTRNFGVLPVHSNFPLNEEEFLKTLPIPSLPGIGLLDAKKKFLYFEMLSQIFYSYSHILGYPKILKEIEDQKSKALVEIKDHLKSIILRGKSSSEKEIAPEVMIPFTFANDPFFISLLREEENIFFNRVNDWIQLQRSENINVANAIYSDRGQEVLPLLNMAAQQAKVEILGQCHPSSLVIMDPSALSDIVKHFLGKGYSIKARREDLASMSEQQLD